MEFVEYPDREVLMLSLARRLSSELADCLRRHDSATLCVPGGSTPGPIFDVLSGQALDWDRVAVCLNDERWVGEDSPRSNTAMLRQRLLVEQAAAAYLIPLYAPTDTPEEALEDLAQGFDGHLPLSVLLLGMGADMHTASLFPGADNLSAALSADAPRLLAMRAEGAGEPRITLSAPVLDAALNKHVVITGADKRAAFEAAMTLPPEQAPIRAVVSGATIHWAE